MTLRLSSVDLKGLQRAARLLVSPLEYPTATRWRSAVNNELRSLIHADSAGFLLPDVDGPLLYSEEHDAEALARYPDFHPPALPDGTSIWARLIANRVSTMPTAYADDVGVYTRSAYYNEYASPNGAHDTLCAMLSIGGADPRQVASVQLWRDRTNRRRFGERDRQLLSLVFPALTAGIKLVGRWNRHRAQLLETLDRLGHAVLVCDVSGRAIHQTPALTAILGADPGAAVLRGELQAAILALRGVVRYPHGDERWLGDPPTRETRTAQSRYRISASVHGMEGARGPLLLAALDRLTPESPSPEQLRRMFGLTPAEARVALLLSEGRSNAEIARTLGVSGFTARRHTERILRKLDVPSRAAVGPRISAGR